jgi:hypothetical protein
VEEANGVVKGKVIKEIIVVKTAVREAVAVE